jgi:predicted nucleic acid-binding protein
MTIVLDVSIAAKWFLPDERASLADSVLQQVRTEGAYVPALFRWEIANVLLSAENAHRISSDDVDDGLDLLRDLPIFVDPPGDRIFGGGDVQLARHYDLTPYDAAYLNVAASRRLPLATADAALAHAARDLGIKVLFDGAS